MTYYLLTFRIYPAPAGSLLPAPARRLIEDAGIEAVRRVVGAGRFTARNPGSLLEYDPEAPGPQYSATHVVRHLALGYPEPRIL